jgi:hypothetical protein
MNVQPTQESVLELLACKCTKSCTLPACVWWTVSSAHICAV